VVDYLGRRSGRPRRLVTQYTVEDSIVRINVGMSDRKTWWRNFTTGHPLHLHLADHDYDATAHVVRDGDRIQVVARLDDAALGIGTAAPASSMARPSGLHYQDTAGSSVDLFWLPLGAGAGGRCVRGSGHLYEALAASRRHRSRSDLYHSALIVRLGNQAFAIEMAPVWATSNPDRGVVAEGSVGMPSWGRSRLFRYEIRCWREGTIPDLSAAVDSPRRVSADTIRAREVLALVGCFPTATWGRDEQHAGEMWNSNSLTAWLLARSGHDMHAANLQPPEGGRAPGWSAGLVVADAHRVRSAVDVPLLQGTEVAEGKPPAAARV
jgi:hypothetical protein